MIIPPEDIINCHYLPNGGIILILGNRKPGSAYSDWNQEWKEFPYQLLTRRRNSLLYEVRKLKREGKVKKFFTDYDGSISIKRSVDGPKIKITSITKDPKDKKNTDIKSFTIAELRDLVNE